MSVANTAFHTTHKEPYGTLASNRLPLLAQANSCEAHFLRLLFLPFLVSISIRCDSRVRVEISRPYGTKWVPSSLRARLRVWGVRGIASFVERARDCRGAARLLRLHETHIASLTTVRTL